MSVLAAHAVTVRRENRTVLEDVSVEVRPGEVVGLLGPNGSGKSTLLKAMSGLIKPCLGSVCLDGGNIDGLPRGVLARRAGYLPQSARSEWPLSVRDVVALGRVPFTSLLQRATGRDRDAVERALLRADCLRLADRPVNMLSGGELTRTMIARVLAGEPELMLLDEPVTGLDPRHQLALMSLLRDLVAPPEARGVLVVLHDLALAARFCDRVHILAEGKVIAAGPVAEALTEGTIAHAFGVSVRTLSAGTCSIPVPWQIVRTEPEAETESPGLARL